MKTHKKKALPEFKSRKEAAEFWDTHSSVDYWDEFEDVKLELHPSIKRPSDLSPKCPLDHKVLLTRYIDLYLADGRVKLEKIEELYCREGHYARLAPEANRLVLEIQAALKRVRPPSEKIAA